MPPKFTPIPASNRAGKAAAQAQRTFAQGLALHQNGALAQARVLYAQVLKLQPRHFDALHLTGVIAVQTGNYAKAVEWIGKAIQIDPKQAAAYNNRGIALNELGQRRAALDNYERAIKLKSDYAEAWNNRGKTLNELTQHEAAIDSFERALAFNPGYAEAWSNRAQALSESGRHAAAIESCERAIALMPGMAEAWNNRGNALNELKQYPAALDSYERATALNPGYAQAWNNRGVVLRALKRHQAAVESCERALALNPRYAAAYNTRGLALNAMEQHQAAIESFDRALALDPDYAEAWNNRGSVLNELTQHQAALESYDRALALKPDFAYLPGQRLHTAMLICEWAGLEEQLAALAGKIGRGEKASDPFTVAVSTGDPALQRRAAEIWVNNEHPADHSLPPVAGHPRHDRIRVGYFSADFRNHAVSILTAGLFEAHDKSKFEPIAFSSGPDSTDDMRKRLVAAFSQFIDVEGLSDRDVALLARKMEIDIAIDLGGFTAHSRTGIFAMRAAPIQVSYIGFGGTMGAEYIDYLIADPVLVPEYAKRHYAEKIACLPSYQANDSTRRIADKVFARDEAGLPPTGFLFCCFNANYKITPCTFDSWMGILRKVDGSVLWLLEGNPVAARNLRREAVNRGIDAERLIFAPRIPADRHLARHRLADLFLDTLPCNAGATASDALWAGLPVLTCMGETFVGRAAASLLYAAQLPELITSTQEEYDALAIELAGNPSKLAQIKQKLADNRLMTDLFDTQLFARHIEDAYTAMVERYQAGLPPEHLSIQRRQSS